MTETTVASRSRIRNLRHVRADGADIIAFQTDGGRTVVLALADDTSATVRHRAALDGRTLEWTGHFGRFDRTGGGQ